MDELQKKYDSVYKSGKESFFSKFKDGKNISETESVVWNAIDWRGKRVVDIGCGTGEIAAGISKCGAEHVLAVDYAASAIEIANKKYSDINNIEFLTSSFDDFASQPDRSAIDVLVSLGTLEHMDDPQKALHKMVDLVGNNGQIILTCPYFINTRGLVWMTLALALNVPMSLTDKHFISPFDIRKWLDDTDYILSDIKYFDNSRANGSDMIVDMEKRLHNALSDANLPVDQLPQLMRWLTNLVEEEGSTLSKMHGASALYLIKRDENI